MDNTFTAMVKPNQIWADNDARAGDRQVPVVELDGTHAIIELHQPRNDVGTAKPGRRTRIALNRFKPTSTGYRLLFHADGTPAET